MMKITKAGELCSPPYFIFDLLAFAHGDGLLSIIEIYQANLIRVSPILKKKGGEREDVMSCSPF
jgi:hypothetical protein